MHYKWQLYVWKGTRVLPARSFAYFSCYFGKKLTRTFIFLLLNIAPVFPVCHANEIFFTIKQLKLVVPGFDLNPRGVNVSLAYEDTHFWHAYYGFFVVLILVMIITKISKQYIFRVPSVIKSYLNFPSGKRCNRWRTYNINYGNVYRSWSLQ